MNNGKMISLTVAMFGLAIAGTVGAQQTVPVPPTQINKAACAGFDWNAQLRSEHPRLPGACQDVVVYNGVKWARLAADFRRIDRDGKVRFDIRDKAQNNRFITDVTFAPRPGQVVYTNNASKRFDQLTRADVVNLYVPESGYEFSAQPGVAAEDLTLVAPETPMHQPPVALADRGARPAVLPQTASNIPLLALGGLLSLFGGLALTLRRRFF